MWHLCWPLWLGLAGGTFAPPDWKLQKISFCLFDLRRSPGGMRLRRVRCVVGHLHRRQGANPPQVCQHQSCLDLASTRVASSFSAPTNWNLFGTNQANLFGTDPSPQGFQWFSLLLKVLLLTSSKSTTNIWSLWKANLSAIIKKKHSYNSVIMPHWLCVCIAVNDSVGSFYEGDSNL